MKSRTLTLVLTLLLGVSLLAANANAQIRNDYARDGLRENYLKGLRYGAEGQVEDARAEFQRIAEVAYADEPVLELLGVASDVIERKVDPEGALELFKGALSIESARVREGLDHLERAIKTASLRGLPYFYRGEANLEMEKYDQALSDFDRAIKANSGLALAYCRRGAVLYRKNDIDRALSDLDRALKLDKDLAAAHFYKGAAYTKVGLYDDAISEYSIAITKDPDYADAYNGRGIVHMVDSESRDKACSDFKKLCELSDCMKFRRLSDAGYCD